MALNIRNEETERLAAELARLTGQSKTQAVTDAVRERLAWCRKSERGSDGIEELTEIADHCARLRPRDERSAEAILGYDERGLPG